LHEHTCPLAESHINRTAHDADEASEIAVTSGAIGMGQSGMYMIHHSLDWATVVMGANYLKCSLTTTTCSITFQYIVKPSS